MLTYVSAKSSVVYKCTYKINVERVHSWRQQFPVYPNYVCLLRKIVQYQNKSWLKHGFYITVYQHPPEYVQLLAIFML